MIITDKINVQLHPVQYNEDDRAQRILNAFPVIPNFQINVSYVESTQHVVAWHMHGLQTDYWLCIRGAFKVGLAVGSSVQWEYLSDKNLRVLEIKPGVYHGYRAVVPGSILLYCLDHKYDPADEFRAAVGAFKESWDADSK